MRRATSDHDSPDSSWKRLNSREVGGEVVGFSVVVGALSRHRRLLLVCGTWCRLFCPWPGYLGPETASLRRLKADRTGRRAACQVLRETPD